MNIFDTQKNIFVNEYKFRTEANLYIFFMKIKLNYEVTQKGTATKIAKSFLINNLLTSDF